MDVKTLKSFITVAKHNSFSEAAKELHTVQPAISRHISALEAELSVTLFNRNSRDVAITEAGEQLLKDATTILALTEQAKSQVKLAHNGQIGSLNIGYLASACLTFMATLVQSYKQQFPEVHITLFEMTATELIEAFKRQQIDVAFSRPLPSSITNEYQHHDIYIDKLVAIVNQNHTLSQQKKLPITEFKNEQFIIFHRDEAHGLFDETIMICKQAGFSPNITSQPRNMQTLITEVAAGLGVAIAPYCVSKLHTVGCHFIDLDHVATEIPLQLQYKKTDNNATVDAFIEIVLNTKKDIQKSMVKDN